MLALLLPALIVLLLAGCAGPDGQQTPLPTESSLAEAPANPPAEAEPAQPSPAATATATLTVAPRPRSATSPILEDVVVRTGRVKEEIAVRAQPEAGAAEVGQLAAGRLVIISDEEGPWYQIVFADGLGGHGWLPADAVRLSLENTGPTASPVATEQSPEPTPSAAAGGTATGLGGVVLADRLNVRAGPGTSSSIVGQLDRSERVAIVGRQEGWLQIAYPDAPENLAWISAAYVAVDGEPAPVLPTPQPAQVAGLAGKLVFQTRNGGEIYIIDADGNGLRRLADGFEPALSPDGTQVAFTRWYEPRGLWLIDADGSNERLLLGGNRPRSPAWTADGSGVIFEREVGSVTCRSTPFGCIAEDELRRQFGGQDCVTTPFGTICIDDFTLISKSLTGLTEVSPAEGTNRDLPASKTARAPAHSPVDDRVVYLDQYGLAVTSSVSDEAPRRVIDLPNALGAAAFTPDGRYFYIGRRQGDQRHIWRYTADGSQGEKLTSWDPLASEAVQNVAPTVSPDGQSVAFFTDRRGKWELWVMDADGSNQRPLAPEALAGIDFNYDFGAERMVDWGP